VNLIVEADGGSRGNPGIAGSGSIVIDAATGEVLETIPRALGVCTNNVAEYTGLVLGLQAAFARDPEASVEVRMDSKLVVEQMSGRWKIKHPDMQKLAAIARELIAGRDVRFTWIPRAKNARADAAANAAMDRPGDYQGPNPLAGDSLF
jgi:probable phosphoglycerate mutase